MELFIIFIILMIILSSLSKLLKEGEGKGEPFDFSDSDLPYQDDYVEALRGKAGEAETHNLKKEVDTKEKGFKENLSREERSKSYVGTSTGDSYGFPSREDSREQAVPRGRTRKRKKSPSAAVASSSYSEPSRADPKTQEASPRRRAYEQKKDGNELEKELERMFKGDKVYAGIVASEVLGPPRAKKPYRCRQI